MKIFLLLVALFILPSHAQEIPSSAKANKIVAAQEKLLREKLQSKNFIYGSPIFIRIFKAPSVLEVWIKNGDQFKLFNAYTICTYSGKLGPKTKQGDHQAPEGFYNVHPRSLNPHSKYHLSFNLGYPNHHDQINGYTGNALMVHGKCASIGCYAMGDANIEEIYALIVAAFKHGQTSIHVNIFPFELEQETLNEFKDNEWFNFWSDLKKGYDYFNKHKNPPTITVKNKRYYLR